MISIISCGAAKLERPAPARELYTGGLFRATLRYVEAQKTSAICILSAKYGLVDEWTQLEPYDQTLSDLSAEEIRDWRELLWAQFGMMAQGHDILAPLPMAYENEIAGAIIHAGLLGLGLSNPVRGMTIGRRLQWLKANT